MSKDKPDDLVIQFFIAATMALFLASGFRLNGLITNEWSLPLAVIVEVFLPAVLMLLRRWLRIFRGQLLFYYCSGCFWITVVLLFVGVVRRMF